MIDIVEILAHWYASGRRTTSRRGWGWTGHIPSRPEIPFSQLAGRLAS